MEDPDISFVAHETYTSLKDTIHSNMKGSSILARNLGDIFIICSGKGRGESPGVIFSNRINYIHSNVDIHLDGKAVGSHGCDGNY